MSEVPASGKKGGSVIVFGAGSLGSLIGGLLARNPDANVTLVGRDPHIAAIRDAGLGIEGAVTERVFLDAHTTVPESADLAIVTVKSFDTKIAGRALSDCGLTTVLSLQNGIGNEETLVEELGEDVSVLAGTCTYGAMRTDPGHVRCTGIGEIVLGPTEQRDTGRMDRANRIGRLFERAGLNTTVADDMPRRLWEKLAVNAGINAPTALARIENGALADSPVRETARRAARETARVARFEGVNLPDEAAIAALETVIEATAQNRSSMLQDVQMGRRTEIDSINGYVAECNAVTTPVNRTLAQLLRAWERKRELRE